MEIGTLVTENRQETHGQIYGDFHMGTWQNHGVIDVSGRVSSWNYTNPY